MTLSLAQMMPGMEWIPVMLLLTGAGILLGLVALILLPFTGACVIGRRLGNVALVIGIVSPLFFLCVAGSEFDIIGYMILAVPAPLGGLARSVHTPRPLLDTQ